MERDLLGEDEQDMEDEETEFSSNETAGASTLAPLFRPAQTEREIEMRRSSHAYLVEQREAEPWSKATLHAPDTNEARAMRERCFGPFTPS